MNAASTVLARLICAAVFGPVDRTARRFERFYAEELAAVQSRTPWYPVAAAVPPCPAATGYQPDSTRAPTPDQGWGSRRQLTEEYRMNFSSHTPSEQRPGKQWRFNFPNGFGASVINDGYGAESGRYELAVLGPDGHITYDTPLTDDVLGFLSEEEVVANLDRIAALVAGDVEAEIARRANAERDQRIAELRAELAALETEVPR